MSKTIITLTAAAAALLATTALASTPAAKSGATRAPTTQQLAANALPPASNVAPAAAGAKATYAINGFRTAEFGMTEDQVKAAIAHDFGIAADKIRTEANPLQKTSALVVSTALPPGPGQAVVTYIFGATSHRLMYVRVIWSTGTAPTTADRQAIASAGLQLVTYFRAQPWDPKTQDHVGVVGNGEGLVMFDAADAKGASVQVEAVGIPVTRQVNGKSEATDPKGAAALRVSYAQDAAHPDVYQIQQGAF